LLDEATSNLDPDTEAALLDALLLSGPTRTVVVVTHRMHIASRADKVLVLDKGRLVASGTHAEVVASYDPYAQLFVGHAPPDEPSRLRMVREER
jgi:ABC-type multidrug transport system fused ATPase/permease subunit